MTRNKEKTVFPVFLFIQHTPGEGGYSLIRA